MAARQNMASNNRILAAQQLAVVAVLTALSLSLLSIDDTVGEGVWLKALLVARMATLVLVCHVLLRRGGET